MGDFESGRREKDDLACFIASLRCKQSKIPQVQRLLQQLISELQRLKQAIEDSPLMLDLNLAGLAEGCESERDLLHLIQRLKAELLNKRPHQQDPPRPNRYNFFQAADNQTLAVQATCNKRRARFF